MVNILQLRESVVRPTLNYLEMGGDAAEILVLGTGLVESNYVHIKQIGGPALGYWQVEPQTMDDIFKNYLSFRPILLKKINKLLIPHFDLEQNLTFNLPFGIAMCRIVYRRDKKPLPPADEPKNMAEYWKRVYNTAQGKGTVEKSAAQFTWLINHLRGS